MFVDLIDNFYLDPKNSIYLIIYNITGYLKINKSIYPKVREGILQSKNLEIH